MKWGQGSFSCAVFLSEPATTTDIAFIIVRNDLKTYMEGGGLSLGEAPWSLIMGAAGGEAGQKAWITREVFVILWEEETKKKSGLHASGPLAGGFACGLHPCFPRGAVFICRAGEWSRAW
jgi:hypothetical protein